MFEDKSRYESVFDISLATLMSGTLLYVPKFSVMNYLYCTLLYCTLLNSTLSSCNVLYFIPLCSTLLYCTVLLARSPRRSTGIRVASVIEFSVCLCVCLFSSNFLILLQYNIRPPSRDCSPCTIKFAASVNLKTHDTWTRTVMNVLRNLCPV